jgi:coiled-coil domain-containing protein 12
MLVDEHLEYKNIDIDKISQESVMDLKDEEDMEKENFEYNNKNESSNFPYNLSSTYNNSNDNYRQIVFRNYIPNDKSLPVERIHFFDRIYSIENYYEKRMRRAVKDFINLEKNPLNIVPKKNNADLKKNLGKKLEKLNKKTELAILEIIKENIQKQGKELTNNNLGISSIANEDNIGNKLVMATNMQLNLEEQELKNEEQEEDVSEGEEVSSNYDDGINDI